jgi:hypothetical protein
MDPAWVPAHVLLDAALTLLLFGWIGIYARMGGKGGMLATIGFVLVFIGTAGVSAITFSAYTIEPAVAAVAPNALEAISNSPAFLVGFATIILFTIGGILFGASIVTSRTPSRLGGALLAVGAALLLLTIVAGMPEKVLDAMGIVFAIGTIVLGRSLWSSKA